MKLRSLIHPNIRQKMMLATLPALLSLGAVLLASEILSSRSAMQDRGALLAHEAEIAALRIQMHLSMGMSQFQEWKTSHAKALGQAIEQENRTEIGSTLTQMTENASGFAIFVVLSSDGIPLFAQTRSGQDLLEVAADLVQAESQSKSGSEPTEIAFRASALLEKAGFAYDRTWVLSFPSKSPAGEENGRLLAFIDWEQISGIAAELGEHVREWGLEGAHAWIHNKDQILAGLKNGPENRDDCVKRTRSVAGIGALEQMELSLAVPSHSLYANVTRLTIVNLVLGITGAVLLLLFSWYGATTVSRSVKGVIHRMEQIVTGDFDLRQKLPESRKDELGELGHWFNRFASNMGDVLCQVKQTVAGVSEKASVLSEKSSQLKDSSANQAATLEQIHASLHEISDKAGFSAKAVEQINDASATAEETARRAKDSMAEACTAMLEIRNAGQEVRNVMSVINDIAFQTNLLALNAAVEAARAGEAGKGFAVVAEEVRALAQRCALAAKETGKLLTDSSDKSDHGSQLVLMLEDEMRIVEEQSARIQSHMGDVADSALDQAKQLGQIKEAMVSIEKAGLDHASDAEDIDKVAVMTQQDIQMTGLLIDHFKAGTVCD